MSHLQQNRKLFECLTQFDGDLRGALFTTYNFDVSYFEDYLLPTLLKIRVDEQENEYLVNIDLIQKLKQMDICVIADGKVNHRIKKNLFAYEYLPIFDATQHSKIFVLEFEESFRLILGSANLTREAIHRNREVYIELELSKDSDDWPIFYGALKFLEELATAEGGRASKQLKRWETKARRISGRINADSASTSEFIGVRPTSNSFSLRKTLDRFLSAHGLESVGDRRVDEIYLLSPFFEQESKNPNAHKSLLYSEYMELKGKHPHYPSIYLYLPTRNDNISVLFPQKTYKAIAEELGDCFLVFQNPELATIEKQEEHRFPHGKLYALVNKNSFTLTVLGSSNFSPSGFGVRSRGKNNWEANIALFAPTYDKGTVRVMFPKDQQIDGDVWQSSPLPEEPNPLDPDSLDEIVIVLAQATLEAGILKIRSIHPKPDSFSYQVSGVPLSLTWKEGTSSLPFTGLNGLSIEVRDQTGLVMQDLPIYFSDQSWQPTSFDIPKADLVSWIESRYLNKKELPLSFLLESLRLKRTAVKATHFTSAVNTDDYVMYRVKLFNHLMGQVTKTLNDIKTYPKRVEYHLVGQFGLITCISEYLANALAHPDLEVFYLYQAVELTTAVLATLIPGESPDTLKVFHTFWMESHSRLGSFRPSSPIQEQARDYLESLHSFAQGAFVESSTESQTEKVEEVHGVEL